MSDRKSKICRREFLRVVGAGALICSRRAIGRDTSDPADAAIYLEHQPTGSEIWQVTKERFRQSNIYCELPYCSGDCRHFIYERYDPKLSGKNKTELMVVELGTWKQRRLDLAWRLTGSAITGDGTFYYLKQTGEEMLSLMRADLSKGTPEEVYQIAGESSFVSLGTVSTDERYYVCGRRLGDDYRMFGIMLVDLQKGAETIIDRDPFILNPHPQFERGSGNDLMIQHNRGGKYTPEGKRIRLVGPEGATLYLLSVPEGGRTELRVGTPHTTPVTGHETWIGVTKEILLTVIADGDYAPDKGNLLAVGAGSPARIVANGYKFNHLGVSRCGRFFCCDDWRGTAKIVIGSILTGRTAVVCESRASMGSPQNTHPHAYLTPDLKWVIFNSDRSGFPHVHAASVPEGMIEGLLEA